VTIHDTHPFADPDPDPVRRLRGRLGGAVGLLTAGSAGGTRAGLTVTSMMIANGEPPRLLALLDPDSDVSDVLADHGRAVVQLLSWTHRDLADAFAGVAPAPGGPWRLAAFVETEWGPRLDAVTTWAGLRLESTATVGWSDLVTLVIEEVAVGDDDRPVLHRRGRYLRP
jgi:flavin reductase (DIM6/NTAB) family NADH-FMN oxidoreductase RutF